MKKLLSVMLVLVLLLSSVCTGVWASDNSVPAGTNLMKDYTYKDWKVTSRATINAPTESFSGDTSNAFSVTKLMWRSAYAKIDLEAGETYKLTFYYKEEDSSKVYLTDSSNRGVLMAPTGTMNFGDEITFINNDYSNNLLTDLNYNIPSDKEGWNIVTALISPSVTGEHTFCFTGAGPDVNDLSLVHFSDFSLVKQAKDPNVLNDSAMAGLTWNAIWDTGLRNPVASVLDKSQSYSGNSYAMTFGRNSRYRDNYITVTLEPNTTYNFSFRYKSGTTDELIHKIGFVDASKVNMATYKGDFVKSHLTDASTSLLGENEATIGQELGGVWNLVSTTFTTGTATEYIMYIFVGEVVADQGFTTMTLSDFSLVAEEKEQEIPETDASQLLNVENWNSTWRLQGSTVNIENSTDSCKGGEAISVDKSNWRTTFVKLTLTANTKYDLTFNYKGTSAVSNLHLIALNDIDEAKYATNPDHIIYALKAGVDTVFTQSYSALNYDGNTWNEIAANFTTKNNTEYYLVFENNTSGSGFVASDFSLVAEEKEPEQPDEENALANSKATDWFSSWNSNSGTTTPEGYFKVLSAWRSAYTKVTLEKNTKYELSFSHGEVKVTDIRVFAASEITDPATQLVSASGGGVAPGGTTNLATDAVVTTCPATPAAGEFYTSSESFTTTDETEYYIFLDCGAFNTTSILLKDLKLVAKKESEDSSDPNALNDTVMAGLTWNAIWNTGLRNPKNATLDKTQSYSGNAYAMTFDRNARYRDNYITVTLKPNTSYSFSFRYKSSSDGQGEVISDVGFVDASKVDFATYKGDTVAAHLTDSATPILGKDNAVKEQLTDGTWNLVTTTFTTGDASKYVMYLNCQTKNGDAGFQILTLSDFSLTEQKTEEEPDPNVLNDNVMKALTWKALWGSSTLNPKGADLDKAESYSGNSYAMTFVRAARYRDNYTTVTLKPNTIYKFSFRYKSTTDEVISGLGFVDASKADFSTIKGDRVTNHLIDSSVKILGSANANIEKEVGGVWNYVSTAFKTGDATEYVMYLGADEAKIDDSFTSMTLSDFSLLEGDASDYEEEVPDPDNVLAYTKAEDWTSSWGGKKGEDIGNGIGIAVAWRSAYTKVTLEPNVTYHFSFDFENVKVKDIRVFPASEITDPATQLISGENGGAAEGGKNNIATDAVTSDCVMPEAGKKYSAFEAFTTTSATEYYIIIDCTEFAGRTDIFLRKLSLKLYFDPKTDVYGTVRSSMGGTVTNLGKTPYTKGKETTLTATPNEGNTFEGWFNAAGQKVSSDENYTFVVDKEFELMAKFSGYNMPYIDLLAENGMDGTFETGSMPGWYAMFNGELATWATFKPSDYVAHNGNRSMQIIARHQSSYFDFNNLAKNTDYYLNFYIYCADKDLYDPETNTGFKMNDIHLNVGSETHWSKNSAFSEGRSGWHRVELFFNTGDSESAQLCINYYGDASNEKVPLEERAVYLDDVMFVQYYADALDNGDFEDGKTGWMGEYEVTSEGGSKVASLSEGNKLYQSVETDQHSLYTVGFRAKGDLVAAASKINKYSTNPLDIISSETTVNTTGDWKEYSFKVYTGVNKALNLIFEALGDGAAVDDIKITKHDESTGGVVENIDFETERFNIKNSNTQVYEIYEGGEGDANVHSGSKSLHFKYNAADSKTQYPFEESYLDFQISNKRVYKLSFYYKTKKGNTIKISPDFLGEQAGKIGIKHTAANDGWNKVEFYVSSATAAYFKPVIANIVGETKADFYIDDITYTVVSAVVIENNIDKIFAEAPLGLLYNESFEEPITKENWGKFPSTMKVVEGDTEYGKKYLRAEKGSFYVLPVEAEAGSQYYMSATVRGTGGYIGLSTTADGKSLFEGVTGEIESFIAPKSEKWSRSGFKFSAPMSGNIYLVISCDSGYFEVDNVLIYKENYGRTEDPNDYTVRIPYDFEAMSGPNYVANGGYDLSEDSNTGDDDTSENETPNGGESNQSDKKPDKLPDDESDDNSYKDSDEESYEQPGEDYDDYGSDYDDDFGNPETGDTFPAVAVILVTLFATMFMLLSVRKNKKEAE